MKSTLKFMALALIAGGTMFAQSRLSIGIGVGSYPAPPAYGVAYQPACPGPGYTWVDGYWGFNGGRRVWIGGFWRAPERFVARRDFDRGRNEFRERDRHEDHGRDFRR